MQSYSFIFLTVSVKFKTNIKTNISGYYSNIINIVNFKKIKVLHKDDFLSKFNFYFIQKNLTNFMIILYDFF